VRRQHSRQGALSPPQAKRRATRRLLRTAAGTQLTLPPELRGRSARSRAARAAWEEMHLAGRDAAAAEAGEGVSSVDARLARQWARRAQEELLTLLGYDLEEVVARYSQRTREGLDSIALLRY